jgi:hypothetical protein
MTVMEKAEWREKGMRQALRSNTGASFPETQLV